MQRKNNIRENILAELCCREIKTTPIKYSRTKNRYYVYSYLTLASYKLMLYYSVSASITGSIKEALNEKIKNRKIDSIVYNGIKFTDITSVINYIEELLS